MGLFGGNPFKALGHGLAHPFGLPSPGKLARGMVGQASNAVPGGLPGIGRRVVAQREAAAAPAQSTMTAKPISDESTVPSYTPVPQSDWKTAGVYGNDTTYGTGLDQSLGTRLSGGDWSNY